MSGRPEDLRTRRIDPKLAGLRDRRFRGLEDMRTSGIKGQFNIRAQDVGTNEDKGPRGQRTKKR
jgi:hypothetical protein